MNTVGLNADSTAVMTLGQLVMQLKAFMSELGPACPVHALNLRSRGNADLEQANFHELLERLASGDCKLDVAPIYNGNTQHIIGLVLGYHGPVVRPDGARYEPPCLRL